MAVLPLQDWPPLEDVNQVTVGGTLTNLAPASGALTFVPNPIVTTGTIDLTVPVAVANGGTGAANLNGFVVTDGTHPLVGAWDAGNFRVTSANSLDVYRPRCTGDAVYCGDFVTVALDNTVTSATAAFVAGDVTKAIVLRGAGVAGATLVTTISAVNGPNSIEVTVAPTTGIPAGTPGYYGTNNTAAFTAAVLAARTATNADGGTVALPEGRHLLPGYTLDLTLANGVTILGGGNSTAGGATATQLVFTTAAGPCIDVRGSSGVTLRNFSIFCENSAFAGSIVAGNAASTSFLRCEGLNFDSAGAGATTAIDLDSPDSLLHSIDACSFYYGDTYVKGAAPAVRITRCQFGQASGVSPSPGPITAALQPSGDDWYVAGNSFEPGRLLQANAIVCPADCHGLTIEANWFGDTASVAGAQAFMKLRGGGLNVIGNFVGTNGATNVTAVQLMAACVGVVVKGNNIDFGATAGCIGIDGGGFANIAVDFTGNRITSPTTITGFDSSNYFSQGVTANHRFGVGALTPDVDASYAAGNTVVEARGRSLWAVFEATGNAADADNTIQGEFIAAANSQTAGNKRIVAQQGVTDGTTATNRGGKYILYTKADAGALTPAFAADRSQNLGVKTITPTRTLDVNGEQRHRGMAAPAVSEANSGVIYFDSALNRYRVSMNGGAYVDLIGSAGLTGTGVATKIGYWTNATNLDSLANLYADAVNHRLGVKVAAPAYQIDCDGDINITTGSVVRYNTGQMIRADVPHTSFAAGINNNGTSLGDFSTAIGISALNASTGTNNTAIGSGAGNNTAAGARNVFVGALAGQTNTVGNQNTIIGDGANVSVNNLSNAVAIGYNAVVAVSNGFVLGDSTSLVGVRTSSPVAAVDVNGAVATRHLDIVLAAGANENIALTDASWIRITGPAGGFSLGGFQNGVDGRHLTVFNTTAQAMTIKNLSGGSPATSQILTLTGADVVLAARTSSATFIYEDTQDKWILTAYN